MADAVTTVSAIENTNTALSQHLYRYGEPTLMKNTVLWQLGTEALIDMNSGLIAHIPTYVDSITSASLTDGAATTTAADLRALTFSARNIQLRKYVDAYGIEDMFAHSTRLLDYMERGATFLMQGFAERLDTYAQLGDAAQTTSYGATGVFEENTDASDTNVMWVEPNADGSAHDTVAAGDDPTPEGFFKARKKLRKKNAQPIAKLGNKYAAIIGPETTYKLLTNIAATDLSFEDSSMNMPEVFKDSMVASFAQMVFLESTKSVYEQGAVTASLEYGMADAVTDSEVNAILAADAFYTTELKGMPAQFKIKPFGNGSAINDANDEWASIGLKAFVGYTNGDRASKVVLMPVPLA